MQTPYAEMAFNDVALYEDIVNHRRKFYHVGTGRAFGKPNRTLVPAPMVFRHKTLHLTLTRLGKGRIGLWIIGLLYRKIFFR